MYHTAIQVREVRSDMYLITQPAVILFQHRAPIVAVLYRLAPVHLMSFTRHFLHLTFLEKKKKYTREQIGRAYPARLEMAKAPIAFKAHSCFSKTKEEKENFHSTLLPPHRQPKGLESDSMIPLPSEIDKPNNPIDKG